MGNRCATFRQVKYVACDAEHNSLAKRPSYLPSATFRHVASRVYITSRPKQAEFSLVLFLCIKYVPIVFRPFEIRSSGGHRQPPVLLFSHAMLVKTLCHFSWKHPCLKECECARSCVHTLMTYYSLHSHPFPSINIFLISQNGLGIGQRKAVC